MRIVCNLESYLHTDPRFSTRAGSETYLHAVNRALIDAGHSVTVVCSDRRSECVLDGVRVLGSRFEEIETADVIFTQLDSTPHSRILSARHGKPLVHFVHTNCHIREMSADRRADLFVFCANWLERANRDRDLSIPWIVCHPPVRMKDFRTTTPLNRRKYALMVNLSPEKGGRLLKHFAQELPDVQFMGVEGGYGNQVGKWAGRLPNVKIVKTTEDMREYYREARVLVFPTPEETFGMVAVEAACSGIPSIVTDLPGTREAMGGAAWFVPEDQAPLLEYWTAPLKRLMTDDEFWEHWSERATLQAYKRDPEQNLRHLIGQIETTVERFKSRRATPLVGGPGKGATANGNGGGSRQVVALKPKPPDVTVNSVFPDVFVINLAKRPERMERVQKRLAVAEIETQRVEAVDGSLLEHDSGICDGNFGLVKTVERILTELLAADLDRALILEDDAVFCARFGERFEAFWREVPDDWELLYLGGNHSEYSAKPLTPISSRVGRCNRTLATHAWAIRGRAIRAVLDHPRLYLQPIDLTLAELQPSLNAYASIPNMVWQEPGHSDIVGRDVNYDHCLRPEFST